MYMRMHVYVNRVCVDMPNPTQTDTICIGKLLMVEMRLQCVKCFDHFELDELFKKFIKKHESKSCCPPEFIDNIKKQIKDLPA